MISNPRLLIYSCIAKGTVILAEFASKKEPGIKALALRCIENVPPHHSMISHTVQKRTYALTIDGLYSYFAILDEVVPKSESLWLFSRLKSTTESLMEDETTADLLVNPIQHSLQSKLDPVFAEIIGGDRSGTNSPTPSSRRRKGSALIPLLRKPLRVAKPLRVVMYKKRSQTEAKSDHQRGKSRQIWRKHVSVVLMFDLCVCALMFAVYLWVCKGLQCVER